MPPPSLLERLHKEPGRFDFFQAMRVLLRHAETEQQPREDAIHLRVTPSLNFSVAPVTKFEPETATAPPTLSISFTGLTGPQGVLPQHYTALVMARVRQKDTTLRDYLDMFHQRVVMLLFEAWEKSRLPISVERDTRADTDDAGTRILWSLAGVGTPSLRDRGHFSDDAFIRFGGLFARQPRTAVGMEAMLSAYFGWQVKVEQFSGRWMYLDLENRAQLSQGGMMGAQLGRNAVPGRRVWESQGKLRLRVGPVGEADFRDLLPGGEAHQAFADLARVYCGLEFDVDMQIVLEADAVPWSELVHDEDRRPRLGRTAWVRSHNFGKAIGDAIFALD